MLALIDLSPFFCFPKSKRRKPRTSTAGALVKTAEHTLTISGIPDAATRVGRAAGGLDKAIAAGATKTSAVCAKHGFWRLSAWFLKLAAAAPLIGKIAVAAAVVGIGVCIFHV